MALPLQWRHNERDGVSNHQPHDCLLKRLFFRHRWKKTPKLCVTGLCGGNSPVTGEFPAQRASNAKNFLSWRHHGDITSFHAHEYLWCHRNGTKDILGQTLCNCLLPCIVLLSTRMYGSHQNILRDTGVSSIVKFYLNTMTSRWMSFYLGINGWNVIML